MYVTWVTSLTYALWRMLETLRHKIVPIWLLIVGVSQRRRCQRGAACWCTAWRACRGPSRWRWRTWCSGTGSAYATPSSWCAAARRTSHPTSTSCGSCTASSATSACTSTAPAWVRSVCVLPHDTTPVLATPTTQTLPQHIIGSWLYYNCEEKSNNTFGVLRSTLVLCFKRLRFF